MFGISWGGFNSLQVAARRPPALKAIITLCSTDDRYADDVHYMGGCLLAAHMLSWASTMLALNARPPDPAVVGERWRGPVARSGWRAARRSSRPGSRISAATTTGSTARSARTTRRSSAPSTPSAAGPTPTATRSSACSQGCPGRERGSIGPWGHQYPRRRRRPGRRSASCRSALRWWDHWLKGIDTGIMDEPMLRAWMQEWIPPAPFARRAAGALGRRAVLALPARRRTARRRSRSPLGSITGCRGSGSRRGRLVRLRGARATPALDQRAEDGALSLPYLRAARRARSRSSASPRWC